jgi:hypothetical protein
MTLKKTVRDCSEGKARFVDKRTHPVVRRIARNLSEIDAIRTVKVTRGFLAASSETYGSRRNPVTKPGHPTAVGISLILEEERKEIQFYEVTSAVKGYGSRMVAAVMNALPKEWMAYVLMDWSDGFWATMRKRHRQIALL